jgi:hypothetical protein
MPNTDPQFQEFVQEVAAAVQPIVQQQVPAQQQPAPQGPLQLSVAGQQYQFQNQADLEATLANTFQQFQAKIAELEGGQGAPAPQGDQASQFDQKKFMDTMSTDPIAALEYADKFRKNEQQEQFNALQERVQSQDYALAAYQFKEEHPEFTANPQGHLVLRQIMQSNGWDMNYANLEAALALGQQRGLFPTRDQFHQQLQQAAQPQPQPEVDLNQFVPQPPPQQQYQQQQPVPGAVYNPLQAQVQQAPPPAAPPPPQVPGGTAPSVVPPNFLAQAESMSADQLEGVIANMASQLPPQG